MLGADPNFCWQTFPGLGRAQNFVGRSSPAWDEPKFLLASFPKFRTGSNFCWQAFYKNVLPGFFVGRLSTTVNCLLFLLAGFLQKCFARIFCWQTFYKNVLPGFFVGRWFTIETWPNFCWKIHRFLNKAANEGLISLTAETQRRRGMPPWTSSVIFCIRSWCP